MVKLVLNEFKMIWIKMKEVIEWKVVVLGCCVGWYGMKFENEVIKFNIKWWNFFDWIFF